jgi:hypothetical protein
MTVENLIHYLMGLFDFYGLPDHFSISHKEKIRDRIASLTRAERREHKEFVDQLFKTINQPDDFYNLVRDYHEVIRPKNPVVSVATSFVSGFGNLAGKIIKNN